MINLRDVALATVIQSIILMYLLIMTLDELAWMTNMRDYIGLGSQVLTPGDRLKYSLKYCSILIVPEIMIPVHSIILLHRFILIVLGADGVDE
uniref:Uncharacterized protein n=1 Tax=viral metagenome TaxID=1070528 RepID=A0A6C0BNH6_9ZZZZ